jgi:hypothetical protein
VATVVVKSDDKEAVMFPRRRSWSRRWAAALGFGAGACVGMTLLAGGVVDAHETPVVAPPAVERGLRDVLHTPPLLVRQGSRVTLRYDVVCQADGFGKPCALTGEVFVRRAGDTAYRPTRLAATGEAGLAASVDLPAGGISYYAVVEDGAGSSITVPAGGAVAPQRAWAVPDLTSASLGVHVFGRARKPDGRALAGSWGSGGGAFGLITGREMARIGPSAFDVAPDGTVAVLDQVNDRLVMYGSGTAPRYVPIAFTGGEGDLALGADGTAYVLDQAPEPVVRSYAPSGAQLAVTSVAGSGADMLRAGPSGALLHAYPGEMWLPVGGAGQLLQPSQQSAAARPGLPAAGGAEVVVHARRTEALFALVQGDRVLRAWRVGSGTNLGEIQLAEPYRDGLLVVLRMWTSQRAEFVALVLSPSGLAGSFAVDAVEWAESAALGRFKLAGGHLFQLRSTPAGAEVVSFDLGGAK